MHLKNEITDNSVLQEKNDMDTFYFTQSFIDELKTTETPVLRELRDRALEQAKKALLTEVLTEDKVAYHGDETKYENLHENYGDAAGPFENSMPLLGFGYCYTGEEAYFEKARELMMTYAGYKKWHGKGWSGRGELITGHFCVGMAFGYLFFKDKLTEQEREYIVRNTYEKGILTQIEDWIIPGTKLHAFDTMGHNWWPVCVSSGALAAIVMKDELPDGERLARIAARGLKEWFAYAGNPINGKPATLDNGAYYESVTYFNYAMSEYMRFADIYEAILGQRPFDDKDIIYKTSEFMLQCIYPSDKESYYLPFGDTDGKGMLTSVLYMLHSCPELERLRWYVQSCVHCEDSAVLTRLLFYHDLYEGEVRAPEKTSACYDKNGWAVFRNSYEKNGLMLAVKCGDTWNHAHADAGHFVFYRNGVPEIYDPLCCNYGHEMYHKYYLMSQAHNVVLFNGKGQNGMDIHVPVRCRGQLYNFTDEPGFRYVAADATGPMGRYFRRHLRHFLWLEEFILIYDDIETYEPGEVNFLLHAEKDNCFRMMTDCTVTECAGYRGHDLTPDKYLSYNQPVGENHRVKFISVLLPDENLTPELTKIDNGYRLTCGNTKVYINATTDGSVMNRNCINVMDGITSDAVIVVKKDNKYGVVNGSIVRENGEIKLDTLTRTNGWTDSKTEGWLMDAVK